MIEAGTSKPTPFDVVIVHSFSRFFRDHFELEFYVRRLAKNGVRLVSIAQEMGDDPMHVMMRQIMALFDEYQSKENAKHVLRALKENARHGFWDGSLPPIGIIAAEQRRDHLRALAQRVDVADREVHIIGSKSNLLQTLTAAAGVKPVAPGIRSSVCPS